MAVVVVVFDPSLELGFQICIATSIHADQTDFDVCGDSENQNRERASQITTQTTRFFFLSLVYSSLTLKHFQMSIISYKPSVSQK